MSSWHKLVLFTEISNICQRCIYIYPASPWGWRSLQMAYKYQLETLPTPRELHPMQEIFSKHAPRLESSFYLHSNFKLSKVFPALESLQTSSVTEGQEDESVCPTYKLGFLLKVLTCAMISYEQALQPSRCCVSFCRALPVWLSIAGLHVGLGLALKLYFFRYSDTA